MSCERDVDGALRARGLRRTEQRARILAALRHAAGHLTAAEVHARLAASPDAQHPARVSLSTVYRTLEGLQQAGIVASLDAHPGVTTYEWSDTSTTHHHLRCVHCGARAEVELPRLEGLERAVLESTGFEVNVRHLGLTGVCGACRTARP